jgi:uncharacterized protein YjcR
MNIEEIEKFLKKNTTKQNYVQIRFKKRESIYGLFVEDKDYTYLKAKNFWRIVPQSQLDAYSKSKNMNLAKIFCGVEFTRLTKYIESFEE